MKWKYAATLAAVLMVSMAFAVVATAETPEEDVAAPSGYDAWLNFQEMKYRDGVEIAATNADVDGFSYTDGPYPDIQPNGAPVGADPNQLYGHYASEVMKWPPNNPGGGYSQDASGGAGLFGMGNTHETYIGDQNGNGVIEWIQGFTYRPFFEDGIDNDGDGCIDEKSYGLAQGLGTCGNNIPDGWIYYETGGLGDAGGENGDLMTNMEIYGAQQGTEVYRAFVSPLWNAYFVRGYAYYPQMAGEHISYYSYESYFGVNANPEMDSDQSDGLVGSIDARGFPATPPVNHICSAGYRLYMGITAQREDGTVVTSYELWESYDSHDWNGDGDQSDYVSAYYVVDPVTGDCRQGVNTGVYGYYPRTSGLVQASGYTWESSDARDWTGDGDMSDTVFIWHDVESTWPMVGKMYTSYTYTATVPAFGFGFSGRTPGYTGGDFQAWPLKFGGANWDYGALYYTTSFWLTADEDGDPQSILPSYYIGYGQPGATPGGQCVQVWGREYYLEYINVDLIGSIADSNGDGDTYDTWETTFCPEPTGGGGAYIVEETSRFANGEYNTPLPIYRVGYVYYSADGTAGGLCIMPSFYYESGSYAINDDANGNLLVEGIYYHDYYWLQFQKPDFEFVPGSLSWLFTGDVQPGGTVIGTFDLINTGGMNIKITEDKGIENDKGFKMQGLSARDKIGPDGVIEPRETATFYFAMTVAAGSPIGPMDVKIIVEYGGVAKEDTVTLPIILKMFGNDLSCYRHRQNALRTMRAFDMDDDEGMLHNLEVGDLVILDGSPMAAEDALLLLISWFENGCGMNGHEDVEHAHSASSGLTGQYGMGMQYWGFAPGQEEGNEGNGNGGLTGQDRKDVYGF